MSATLPSDPSVPVNSQKKTTRKQWSLQGGPRGLLQRMRSQLAEDGCPESQLVMGKTLLQQLGEDQETAEEDARLAVFWLTQASLQGNKEATELLENCLNNNIGICDHNYQEIRECLAMDLQEKLARRAAHLLFCSLSDGSDFISSSSLSHRVQSIANGSGEEEKPCELAQEGKAEKTSNLEQRYGGERFTEEHLVSASVLYCEGRVPPLHHYITPSVQTNQSPLLNALSLLVRLTLDIYSSCLHFFGVNVTNFLLRNVNLTSPLRSLFLITLISGIILLLGTVHAYVILPLVVSFVSLLVMIVSTAHMLLIRRRFNSFRMWSLVFSHYCPDLNIVKIENKFKARCWKPYVVMFAALIFYLGTVPLTPSKLLINFIPALYMCSALTLLLVPESLNCWQFLSLALHLWAVTPELYSVVNTWLFPLARGTSLEFIFASQPIYLWECVKLNLGVASLLHIVWCCCCLGVLLKYGIVFLMPHLVGLTWCHLSIMATQQMTESSSLVTPVATWSILVVLPFATPFILTVAPGLLFASLAVKLGFELYIAALILVGGISLTGLLKHWWPNVTLMCKAILVGGILVSFFQSTTIFRPTNLQHSNLQWENYKNACWPSKDTIAMTAHRCLPLQGTLVNWRGSVTQVDIIKVWNLPQSILEVMPEVLQRPLRCYIGRRASSFISNKLSVGQNDYSQLLQNALGPKACTLDNWNEYTFEITLAMSSSSWKFGSASSLIKVTADDVFRDFALGLNFGDELEFIGAFSKNVGTSNPSLFLSSIKCVNCKSKLVPLNKHVLQSQQDLWVAPTFVFNFLMSPLLSI